MKKTIVASMLAAAAFAATGEAKAWGLHNGETVNSGDNMLYGELGFPDVSFGFQHGVSNAFDVGFRFSLAYGWEYRPDSIAMGLGMRVPLRFQIFRNGPLTGLIRFEPGIKIDRFDYVQFGLQFPLGFELGIHMTQQLAFQVGFDLPMNVNTTNGTYFAIVPLFGFGLEYKVDNHIAIGLNTRFGPSVIAGGGNTRWWYGYNNNNNNADTRFGMIVQAGFGYRL